MTAAFDRHEDHSKKHYMPTEIVGNITVVEAAGTNHFPGTGDVTKLYFDSNSGGGDWSLGDFYRWNGTNYVAYVGPHPIKPPH